MMKVEGKGQVEHLRKTEA